MKQAIKSTIQENGQITLPATLRRKYGLRRGDEVIIQDTDNGLLVRPRTSKLLEHLQAIGRELKAAGITQAELIANGRKIRGQLLQEMYGISEDGEIIPR